MATTNAKSRRRVAAIDRALAALYGDPRPPRRADPLETLVRTVLSQNTNDRNRDRAMEGLRCAFPDWEAVADAPLSAIKASIRPGGLAARKARTLRDLLRWARRRFPGFDLSPLDGKTDEEIRQILADRKGIGPKTLAIFLLFALGREAFPVDTHCLRVLTRLNVLLPGTTASRAHGIMDALVAPGRAMPLHLNLIRFGRERCHARKPRCRGCPLVRRCVHPDKEHAR